MLYIRALFLLLFSATFVLFPQPVQAQTNITIRETSVLSAGDGGNGNLLAALRAAASALQRSHAGLIHVAGCTGCIAAIDGPPA
jgi:hypothetical protein